MAEFSFLWAISALWFHMMETEASILASRAKLMKMWSRVAQFFTWSENCFFKTINNAKKLTNITGAYTNFFFKNGTTY